MTQDNSKTMGRRTALTAMASAATLLTGCPNPPRDQLREECLVGNVGDALASIQFTPGIVRVHAHFPGNVLHVGTGFVIDRHHILTAAHVLRPIPTTPHVVPRPVRVQIQEPQRAGQNDRAPVIDATMAVVDPSFTADRTGINEEEAFDFGMLYFHNALPIRNYTAAAYNYDPPRDCNDCPEGTFHTAGTAIDGNSQNPSNLERGTPLTRVRQVTAFRAFTRNGTRMIDLRPAWNIGGDSGGAVFGVLPGWFWNYTRIIGIMVRRQTEDGTPYIRILVLRRDRIQAMQNELRAARRSFQVPLPDETVPTPMSEFWNGQMNNTDPLQMRIFQYGNTVDAYNIDTQIQQASLYNFNIEAAPGGGADVCHRHDIT